MRVYVYVCVFACMCACVCTCKCVCERETGLKGKNICFFLSTWGQPSPPMLSTIVASRMETLKACHQLSPFPFLFQENRECQTLAGSYHRPKCPLLPEFNTSTLQHGKLPLNEPLSTFLEQMAISHRDHRAGAFCSQFRIMCASKTLLLG